MFEEARILYIAPDDRTIISAAKDISACRALTFQQAYAKCDEHISDLRKLLKLCEDNSQEMSFPRPEGAVPRLKAHESYTTGLKYITEEIALMTRVKGDLRRCKIGQTTFPAYQIVNIWN